jgi:alkaline phosphatase
MEFDLFRNETEEPSLAEMTETAIKLLRKDDDGFMLMVEGIILGRLLNMPVVC